jgi:antitoxin HigA-1
MRNAAYQTFMNTTCFLHKPVILCAQFPVHPVCVQLEPLRFSSVGWAGHRKTLPVLYDNHDQSPHDPVFKDIYQRAAAPPHPGEILRDDILPLLELTRAALARKLGVTPRRLANLLAERSPITADLAQRLGIVLGHGPRYWLGLQMQHDVWLTTQPLDVPVTPLKWTRLPKGAKAPSKPAGYR